MASGGTGTASGGSSLLLSRSEQDCIRDGCTDNCRYDGRGREDFRYYTIVTGRGASSTSGGGDGGASVVPPPVIFSNGSARIFCCANGSAGSCSSNIHLLCSVKAEVVHPSQSRPNDGVVELHLDTLTTTTTSSGGRKVDDELRSILSQLLLSTPSSSSSCCALVDTKALCIVPHHYVWRLHVDLYLISGDVVCGGLIDASSHVIRAALRNTLLPAIETVTSAAGAPSNAGSATTRGVELVVDGDVMASRPPPGSDRAPVVVTITVLKCMGYAGAVVEDHDPDGGGKKTKNKKQSRHQQQQYQRVPTSVLILDATPEEEACAYAQVHVSVSLDEVDDEEHDEDGDTKMSSSGTSPKRQPSVTAIHKSGSGSLPINLLPEITSMAISAALRSRKHYQIKEPSREIIEAGQGRGGVNETMMMLQEQFLIQ